MSDDVMIFGGFPTEGFVELARTQKGRLFKKQILHMNSEFVHPNMPGTKIKVTPELAKQLVSNFKAGYADIVQVPIVDASNKHTEDPLKNIGEVVDIEYDDSGVYAIIDARKEEYANELGRTLIGASALMHMDYPDTVSGNKVGPTLLHVAVTNRPYLTNLSDYEEIIAASADSLGDEPVVMSPADKQEDKMPELDELLEMLKNDHGIDVVALREAAERDHTQELVTAMSGVLQEAGVIGLSKSDDGKSDDGDKELSIKDVADAVIELAQEKVELTASVATLVEQAKAAQLREATREVEELIRVGRVLPKQKDAMIKLSMEDHDTFVALVPDDSIVSLAADGVTVHDEPASERFTAETARLAEIANSMTGKKK